MYTHNFDCSGESETALRITCLTGRVFNAAGMECSSRSRTTLADNISLWGLLRWSQYWSVITDYGSAWHRFASVLRCGWIIGSQWRAQRVTGIAPVSQQPDKFPEKQNLSNRSIPLMKLRSHVHQKFSSGEASWQFLNKNDHFNKRKLYQNWRFGLAISQLSGHRFTWKWQLCNKFSSFYIERSIISHPNSSRTTLVTCVSWASKWAAKWAAKQLAIECSVM